MGTLTLSGERSTLKPPVSRAIENIRQVYEILKGYGLEEFITFDLGMLHSLNYYTGIIFKGFTGIWVLLFAGRKI